MAFEHAVALTGGIASGKSTACNLLRLYGLRVIDADAIARDILQAEAANVGRIFGSRYVVDGKVDRKALGALVFSDRDARKRLEELLHPKIREEIVRRSEEQDRLGGPYIVDIPLFFETGAYPIDRVVVVYAPREIQKERLIEREGLSEAEAEARLDAQIDIEEKKERATYLIDNSSNYLQRDHRKQVIELIIPLNISTL